MNLDDIIAFIVFLFLFLCFYYFLAYLAVITSRRDIKKWAKANGYKLKDSKLLSFEERKNVFAIQVVDKKGNELTGIAAIKSTYPEENVEVIWD